MVEAPARSSPVTATRFQRASGDEQTLLEALFPHRRAAVEYLLRDCPGKYRLMYLRAVVGKASPRQTIKIHCIECCGWSRKEAERCSVVECELWLLRPMPKKEKVNA